MGAENRSHPPRCAQGRCFCHADMRPVLVPAWETGLSWLDGSQSGRSQGGQGDGVTLSYDLAPEKQSYTRWGTGLGVGGEDP